MSLPVPAGARWHKFEFHCHTPASDDYGKGQDQAALKQRTAREWLLDYMRAGIDCVAITDHNTGAWVDTLKAEYAAMKSFDDSFGLDGFRELTIFPGVEISAQAGQHSAHILGIFAPTVTSEDITLLIGQLGFQGGQVPNHQRIAGCSALDVCKRIDEAGGVAIPAHVHDDCGLFKELGGNNLEQYLDGAPCFALEVTARGAQRPQAYVNRKLAWTEVVGSDAHHPTGPPRGKFPGSKFTWVKMGPRPCLEGLRLALHDGDPLSIRRSDENDVPFDPAVPVMRAPSPPVEPNKWAENTIESITVSNAQYCGRGESLEVKWSPWLNCIVGGRGSGKSTIVELARLVLRQDGEKQGLRGEPRINFERFRKPFDRTKGEGALNGATEITLIFRKGPQRYRLRWRYDGQGPSVEEVAPDGDWRVSRSFEPEEINSNFRAQIFSQKQVYELSRDAAGLLAVIDASPEVGWRAWSQEWKEEEAKFFALRTQARQIETSIADEPRLRAILGETTKKLKVFEEAGHADVLKHYQVRRRQKQRVLEFVEGLKPMTGAIDGVSGAFELPPIFNDVIEQHGADEADVDVEYLNLIKVVEYTLRELVRLRDGLKAAVEVFTTKVWQTSWGAAVTNAEREFEELKRQLAAVGTSDPNEYGKLVQQRQSIEADLKKLDGRRQQLQTIRDQAMESYKRLAELRRSLTDRRKSFLQSTLANNAFVRIEVAGYGDFLTVDEQFRAIIGKEGQTFAKDILEEENGTRSGVLADLYQGYIDVATPNVGAFEARLNSLKDRLEQCAATRSLVGAKDQRFVTHISSMRAEQFDRLWAWWPEDSLKIEYSDGKGGPWRSITQGSPGQKTAAMLAFLLSYGVEPMILDQPEDDLDNHLIYDLIVRQIRANKTRRQLIVVTHNPNIVVNGDAELVVVMDFRSGQCRVVETGCLQEKSVRDEICRVMEGGREAFENRYRRVILENK